MSQQLMRIRDNEIAVPACSPAVADTIGTWTQDSGRHSKLDGHSWVAHTRSRNEKAVASVLAQRQVEYYLPLVRVVRTYAKRKATFLLPFFPGYLFLWGSHDARETALQTNRVANILDVTDPARLLAELRQVYRALESGETVDLYPSLRKGRRCRVTGGTLKGVEGVVIRRGRRCRIHLSVSMLGQAAVVEIDAALLEPID